MSRNHILSRVYFVSLLSVCCMYLCWCISLIPLQTLTRPVQFVERWLFVPMLISGLITFLFDKDKWFTGKFTKNYHASEQWKDLYPRTYRLEQITIYLIRNSWKYFLLLFLFYCILYGSGILK